MARLPRLVLVGQAHLLIQRGLVGEPVFIDDLDRAGFLRVLVEAAAVERVLLHAWALAPSEVQLLATPETPSALGRLLQAVGRRYVSAHNRRHGRSGSVWAGRYGSAAIEPGALRLAALRSVDGLPGAVETSASQRLGSQNGAALVHPPEYWALGNTPFDREASYRALLQTGVPAAVAGALRQAALGGWPMGSAPFLAQADALGKRPSLPRARGRPRGRASKEPAEERETDRQQRTRQISESG